MTYSRATTSKGQFSIPANLRRKLRIRKGTRLAISEQGTGFFVQPITDEFIHSLKGCLKPKKGQRSMLETLLEDRRREA